MLCVRHDTSQPTELSSRAYLKTSATRSSVRLQTVWVHGKEIMFLHHHHPPALQLLCLLFLYSSPNFHFAEGLPSVCSLNRPPPTPSH